MFYCLLFTLLGVAAFAGFLAIVWFRVHSGPKQPVKGYVFVTGADSGMYL